MNKQTLKALQFKYIATCNDNRKTEVWAKFSGWEDVVQYYFYFPDTDSVSDLMTMHYLRLNMYRLMFAGLSADFFNKGIEYNPQSFWSVKEESV